MPRLELTQVSCRKLGNTGTSYWRFRLQIKPRAVSKACRYAKGMFLARPELLGPRANLVSTRGKLIS